MKGNIISICQMIEESYNCKILFTVESGSRLWRLDSKDSDYDVRFVYVYKDKRKYLDFMSYSDVIEHQDDELKIDMVGFDIKKYSSLLLKSNPNVIDWTMSDILYYGEDINRLVYQSFAGLCFNPRALVQAYRGLALNNLKDIEEKGKNTIKKHLYVLRGFLNADWIIEKESLPPLTFYNLFTNLDIHDRLHDEITRLIMLKRQVEEDYEIRSFPQIKSYIKTSKKLSISGTALPDSKRFKKEHHDLLYNQMKSFFDFCWSE
jgi:predicted nucleotidyltransferase